MIDNHALPWCLGTNDLDNKLYLNQINQIFRISKDEDRTGKPAQKLLRRINFSDISSDEIRAVVQHHLSKSNLSKSFLSSVLSIKCENENGMCDNSSGHKSSRGLINFRGMELAMVKVILTLIFNPPPGHHGPPPPHGG